MSRIITSKFRECFDKWTKLNEKGEQYLSQHVLGQQPSDELNEILKQLRELLDTLFDEYASLLRSAGFEEDSNSSTLVNVRAYEKNSNKLPKDLQLMRECVDMFDQEYMVKESIKDIVSKEGFATPQHLAGCIALWKAESYLDKDIIDKVNKL